MEITVAGRVVPLRLEHFFAVFAALIIVALAAMIATAVSALALSGSLDQDSLVRQTAIVGDVVTAIGMPLFAFLFLRMAGIFRMEKDALLCRSLASANAILAMAVNAAGLFLLIGLAGGFGLPDLISLAGDILSAAAGAVVLYLWLLIAMKPDRRKAEEPAWLSAVFAIAMLLFWKIILALGTYYAGFGEQAGFGLGDIPSLIQNLFFAFAILYHVKGTAIVKKDAAFFAALFIGAYALYSVAYFLQSGIPDATYAIDAGLKLALLYILAGKGRI